MAYWIFLSTIFVLTLYLFLKIVITQYRSRKPSLILQNILFPSGNAQKKKVIEAFNAITKNRFSDKEIIDFFVKEKGLQLFSVNPELSSAIQKYIRKDTLINLDYFERVKFHETFINYPHNFEIPEISDTEMIMAEQPPLKPGEVPTLF